MMHYIQLVALVLGLLVCFYITVTTDSSNNIIERYTQKIVRRGIFNAKINRVYAALMLIVFTVLILATVYL